MAFGPDGGDDETAAMAERLSKDAASWSRERKEQPAEHAATPKRPVAAPASPQPARRATRASAPAPAAKPASARSKPFSMSYDGMTQAQYIQYLLDRKSR